MTASSSREFDFYLRTVPTERGGADQVDNYAFIQLKIFQNRFP